MLSRGMLVVAVGCLAAAGCASATVQARAQHAASLLSVSSSPAGSIASAVTPTVPPYAALPSKGEPPGDVPSEVATQPPQTSVVAAHMLDPTHAVVLVKDCSASGSCAFRAETSSDGGETWHRGAALPLTAVSDGDDPVSGIAMVDATTLDAYGIALWRSSDVGANWHLIAGAPAISLVAASAGSVWVGTACPNLVNCASSLDVESSTGLAPLRAQPLGNVRELVRVGGRSYAVTLASDASSTLALSADGGNTWQQRSLPEQACGFSLGRPLAVSPGGTMYMVCSLGVGAGNEPKRLYRSDDDGRSWHDLGAVEAFRLVTGAHA